jgi:hypothetical protein
VDTLGLLAAIGLSLVAVGFVLGGERRRLRRRATDPRTRHRIASLIDRTP